MSADVRCRSHVYSDLRLYCCTFQDCSSPTWQTEEEWFDHELDIHRRECSCHLCSEYLPCATTFKQHLRASHPSDVTTQQLDVLVQACGVTQLCYDQALCPFCYERNSQSDAAAGSLAQFRSHIGDHFRWLARKALPDPSGELREDPSKDVIDRPKVQPDENKRDIAQVPRNVEETTSPTPHRRISQTGQRARPRDATSPASSQAAQSDHSKGARPSQRSKYSWSCHSCGSHWDYEAVPQCRLCQHIVCTYCIVSVVEVL